MLWQSQPPEKRYWVIFRPHPVPAIEMDTYKDCCVWYGKCGFHTLSDEQRACLIYNTFNLMSFFRCPNHRGTDKDHLSAGGNRDDHNWICMEKHGSKWKKLTSFFYFLFSIYFYFLSFYRPRAVPMMVVWQSVHECPSPGMRKCMDW